MGGSGTGVVGELVTEINAQLMEMLLKRLRYVSNHRCLLKKRSMSATFNVGPQRLSSYLLKHDCIKIQSSHLAVMSPIPVRSATKSHLTLYLVQTCCKQANSIQLETRAFEKLIKELHGQKDFKESGQVTKKVLDPTMALHSSPV